MAVSPDTSESVYGLGITPGLGYITGPEGQRAEQEALRKDRSQARRVVISLVGRERQGKTSLRRLLAGEPFNVEEPSTVGLERQLVDIQVGTSDCVQYVPMTIYCVCACVRACVRA